MHRRRVEPAIRKNDIEAQENNVIPADATSSSTINVGLALNPPPSLVRDIDELKKGKGSFRSWRNSFSRSRFRRALFLVSVTAFLLRTATRFLLLRPPPPILPVISKLPVNIPSDRKVSVVIMNHNRPRMIRESTLLPTLLAHDSIDEVLLCHSNPQTKFEYQPMNPKVKNIDAVEANEKYGLSLRFHFCRQAQNEWVIQIDDDQEVTSLAIDEIITEFARDPHRIVGRYGRQYDFWNYILRNGYDTYTFLGDVEVVLTKFMIHERMLCDKFFEYAPLVQDLVPYSRPKWNAEDIFMSLTANHVYNVPFDGPYRNFAMPLELKEADANKYTDALSHEASVSGNLDRVDRNNVRPLQLLLTLWKANSHCRYRGSLWYHAKKRLASIKGDQKK